MQSPSLHSAQPTTAPISLLRLVAEDESFRAKLESDPVAAFAAHGVNIEFDGKPVLKASAWEDLLDWLDSIGEGENQLKWRELL